ncbi:acyl-CoA synthetase [Myxococcota bacterium]|nr:acyl-CoA synthetase [Myxococcota bacterium]
MTEFNFADIHESLARAIPDREALVVGDRRMTYGEQAERSRRLANFLLSQGLRCHRERSELKGHESGQDHVALYLYNGPEYLEGFFGSFKARLASINVNYRYVEEELLYLFGNARARAVIYHAEFAPRIAAVREDLPDLEVLLQVADDSGNELLPGAIDYEQALSSSSAEPPDVKPSPDDLYILYTGGTTGMPKGVLWRSDDIFVAAMGGTKIDGTHWQGLDEIAETARNGDGLKSLVGPPLMHGAAQWSGHTFMTLGGTLVFPSEVKKLDPADFWSTVEREKVTGITIVGDAFARPLLDELERGDYDVSSMIMVGSGGAPLSVEYKKALLERFPVVIDGMGSSEAGAQAMNTSTQEGGPSTGDFSPMVGSCVLSEDLSALLDPQDNSLGWLGRSGRMPLGYLGDPEKTARTFPVIDGVRYAVPGDRARHRGDGSIELLGRDSVTINSGGEKIFAEEVEAALRHHADVFDVTVAGRSSDRWGQEVVAVLQLRDGSTTSEDELIAEASEHIARYKLPKAFVFVDEVQRSPSGKADYRWAKAVAESGSEENQDDDQ